MRSPPFYASFTGNYAVENETRDGKLYQKIEIKDIEPNSFRAFLGFLYKEKVEVTPKIVMGVLYAGLFFYNS